MLRLNVLLASLLAALGADAAPRAVALVEMGDERPHVREWVEFHLAVGFSHLYVTLSRQATEEVRATLLSYPLVTLMNGSDVLGHHGTGSMTLRAARDRTRESAAKLRGQCEGGGSPDADVAVTRKQWPR